MLKEGHNRDKSRNHKNRRNNGEKSMISKFGSLKLLMKF